eukprot:Skav217714  [mRNA]  locus=scaffold2294:232098:239488:- [translate_table: standard]
MKGTVHDDTMKQGISIDDRLGIAPPDREQLRPSASGTGGGPTVAVKPAFGSDVPQTSTVFSSSRRRQLARPRARRLPLGVFWGEDSASAQRAGLHVQDGIRLAGFDCSGPQRALVTSTSCAAPGSYNPEECMGALAHGAWQGMAGPGPWADGDLLKDSRWPPSCGTAPRSARAEPSVVASSASASREEPQDSGDASGGAFKSQAPQRPEGGASSEDEAWGAGHVSYMIAKLDHVSFGTCAERFGDDCTDVPPPGAYELDSEVSTGVEAGGEGCYSFKATAQRGLPMPKVASQGLDPGAVQWSRLLVFSRISGFEAPAQVEEAAILLQIHEKRPPPRGPFPWAEGCLEGRAWPVLAGGSPVDAGETLDFGVSLSAQEKAAESPEEEIAGTES